MHDGTSRKVPKYRIVQTGPDSFYIEEKGNWADWLWTGSRWGRVTLYHMTLTGAQKEKQRLIDQAINYPIYHYD